jgi:hypothetical protein
VRAARLQHWSGALFPLNDFYHAGWKPSFCGFFSFGSLLSSYRYGYENKSGVSNLITAGIFRRVALQPGQYRVRKERLKSCCPKAA